MNLRKTLTKLLANLFLLILPISFLPQPVWGLSDEYYQLFNEGVFFYDLEECATGGAAAPPTTGTSLGGAEYIGYFKGPQITPTAIVLHWTAVEYTDPLEFAKDMEERTTPDHGNSYPNGRAVQLTIDTTGKVYQLSESLETQPIQTVDDAGWNNAVAIEIESGNLGDAARPHEEALLNNAAQYASVLSVIRDLMDIFDIANEKVFDSKQGIFGHLEIHPGNPDPGAEFMAKVRGDLDDTEPSTDATIATPVATGCACTDPSLSGSNNVQIAFNYFVSKGLSDEQSAGIVGNLMRESGPDLDPTYDSRETGIGIAQWIQGRADNLIAFANATNRDYLTLEVQLDFIWFELTGEPPTTGANGGLEGAAYDALIATKTVEEAAIEFEDKYERSQDTVDNGGTQIRIDFAQEVYDTYAGTASGGSGAGCALGSGELGVFPLITTKAVIEKGSTAGGGVYLTWCFEATSNCHHDYNAADIHVNPGTEVVSSISGEVVSATEAVGGVGSRVVIKSSDGAYVNYYAHMAFGSLTVNSGDTVAAGQKLGEVGIASQAVGTAPHLHIDLLPGTEFDTRPACSGASCASYPFIDIQPILKNLYDTVVPN